MSESGTTPPAHLSERQRIAGEIGIVALIGVVLGLTGPFGSAGLPLMWRFAYWIVGGLAAWACMRLITRVTGEAAVLLRLPRNAGYALAVPLLAVLIMIAVSQITGRPGSPILYLQIVAVGTGFYLLFALLYRRIGANAPDVPDRTVDAAGDPGDCGLADSELHKRLPAGFGPILALGVEDHYVHVHADNGAREMLLMNLADAIVEAGEANGLRVHRSWWLARGAAPKGRRRGRSWALELPTGIEVPVSRANVAAVRSAGWLA